MIFGGNPDLPTFGDDKRVSMLYDHIIIGAGSAGCVLANRLSADPARKVLLLESGSSDRKLEIHIPGAYTELNRSTVDWSFWTEPQKHVDGRRLYIPRGRTLGGSSSTNAMAYVRGNRADYDEWAALGNRGWGYEDLLPYFKRSEHNEDHGEPWHGRGGPLNVTLSRRASPLAEAFLDSCEQAGIPRNPDYNGADQWGASLLQFTIKGNRRHSAAAAFLKPVLDRPNLRVVTRCHVVRILFEKGRAVGVECLHGGRERVVYRCGGDVILSAGAIQSPQILMLSGIGDPEQLGRHGIPVVQSLPGVGKNLQDHVWSGVSAYTNIPTGNSLTRPLPKVKALLQQLLFRTGPLSEGPLQANAFLASDPTLKRPDIQFHMAPFAIAGDYSTDIYDLKTFTPRDGMGVLAILLRPESRGWVGIRSSDPMAPPVIQPDFLSAPEDLARLMHGVRLAYDVLGRPPLKTHTPDGIHLPADPDDEVALREHILRSLETLYHPVGTCRMGRDASAVVDETLRVHGVQNLRVADASVMPTIPSGNTNAPSIMIGEKASDMVAAG
jgi:choline dehydrogenase